MISYQENLKRAGQKKSGLLAQLDSAIGSVVQNNSSNRRTGEPRHARILQIGYSETLSPIPAVLPEQTFSVDSVRGNAEARTRLAVDNRFDMIVIDWTGSYEERAEMIAWLKTHHSGIPVVAIQDCSEDVLPGADLKIAGEFKRPAI